MKRRRLRIERLKLLGVAGEQRRDRRGNLVAGSGQYCGGRCRRSAISCSDRRADIGQVPGRVRDEIRGGDNKRHQSSFHDGSDGYCAAPAGPDHRETDNKSRSHIIENGVLETGRAAALSQPWPR